MSAASAPAVDTARAWETVLQRIESDLIAGALTPGDHLPSERALAAELGVGRSSVREALRVLEVLGLIRTQTGSGPQSGAIIISRPSGGMTALVRLQVAAHGFAVRDVVKTRLVLESDVVTELARASGAAPTPALAPALEILDAMEQPGDELTRDEFLTLDQAFHLALAVASGNEVIAAMMAGLRESIEAYVRVGASVLPSWDDTSTRLKAEHRAIVAAIEAGDPELARTRIRDHIETYHAETNVSSIHPHREDT
ncbi:FadR/GntR family transcriptional regulator [Herbiconiux solani]|uniref:FadR/GntR family transcriptional regulator n=1 Tax=Herbiconiux solani TaxID=661329 RepID=UPI0008244C6E|nr:FCD domain-containing protein [Herbiconiux solani]